MLGGSDGVNNTLLYSVLRSDLLWLHLLKRLLFILIYLVIYCKVLKWLNSPSNISSLSTHTHTQSEDSLLNVAPSPNVGSPNAENTSKVKRCKFEETPTIHHLNPNDFDLKERRSFSRTITKFIIHRKAEMRFFKRLKRWPCYEINQDLASLSSI